MLSVAGGINGSFGTVLVGFTALLGAAAYRSAKRTKLGIAHARASRSILEMLAILAIIAAVSLQRDVVHLAYNDPIPTVVAPIWAVAAYLTAEVVWNRRIVASDRSSGTGLGSFAVLPALPPTGCRKVSTRYADLLCTTGSVAERSPKEPTLIVPFLREAT